MKIFITGGCKNGKSFYAQELLSHFDDSDISNNFDRKIAMINSLGYRYIIIRILFYERI